MWEFGGRRVMDNAHEVQGLAGRTTIQEFGRRGDPGQTKLSGIEGEEPLVV